MAYHRLQLYRRKVGELGGNEETEGAGLVRIVACRQRRATHNGPVGAAETRRNSGSHLREEGGKMPPQRVPVKNQAFR